MARRIRVRSAAGLLAAILLVGGLSGITFASADAIPTESSDSRIGPWPDCPQAVMVHCLPPPPPLPCDDFTASGSGETRIEDCEKPGCLDRDVISPRTQRCDGTTPRAG